MSKFELAQATKAQARSYRLVWRAQQGAKARAADQEAYDLAGKSTSIPTNTSRWTRGAFKKRAAARLRTREFLDARQRASDAQAAYNRAIRARAGHTLTGSPLQAESTRAASASPLRLNVAPLLQSLPLGVLVKNMLASGAHPQIVGWKPTRSSARSPCGHCMSP
jgi:hypothetical protein